jgi:hypothetical protein
MGRRGLSDKSMVDQEYAATWWQPDYRRIKADWGNNPCSI